MIRPKLIKSVSVGLAIATTMACMSGCGAKKVKKPVVEQNIETENLSANEEVDAEGETADAEVDVEVDEPIVDEPETPDEVGEDETVEIGGDDIVVIIEDDDETDDKKEKTKEERTYKDKYSSITYFIDSDFVELSEKELNKLSDEEFIQYCIEYAEAIDYTDNMFFTLGIDTTVWNRMDRVHIWQTDFNELFYSKRDYSWRTEEQIANDRAEYEAHKEGYNSAREKEEAENKSSKKTQKKKETKESSPGDTFEIDWEALDRISEKFHDHIDEYGEPYTTWTTAGGTHHKSWME